MSEQEESSVELSLYGSSIQKNHLGKRKHRLLDKDDVVGGAGIVQYVDVNLVVPDLDIVIPRLDIVPGRDIVVKYRVLTSY